MLAESFFLHILDIKDLSNNSSFILSRAYMFDYKEHRLLCVVSKKGESRLLLNSHGAWDRVGCLFVCIDQKINKKERKGKYTHPSPKPNREITLFWHLPFFHLKVFKETQEFKRLVLLNSPCLGRICWRSHNTTHLLGANECLNGLSLSVSACVCPLSPDLKGEGD